MVQLVEHCNAKAEAIRSNPVEALNFFFVGIKFAIASIAITTTMITFSVSSVIFHENGDLEFWL